MIPQSPVFLGAHDVRRLLAPRQAVAAIEGALCAGLDPDHDIPRAIVDVGSGQLLLMPAAGPDAVGVKLATILDDAESHGVPRIQGIYVFLDGATLTPRALLDGAALTNVRTPATSLAAVRPALRQMGEPVHVVVFGSGPQALGHVAALRDMAAADELDIASVTYAARDVEGARAADPDADVVDADRAADVVARARLVVCATTSSVPLFDGDLVRDDAVVVAIGSHEPDKRELDSRLLGRSQVVVESVESALRECGDVVMAVADGAVRADDLIPMRDVVVGLRQLDPAEPVVFKGAGMSWQDLVIASAIVDRLP